MTPEDGVSLLNLKLDTIKNDILDIKKRLDSGYVTMDRFRPVERLAYGIVGVLTVGVLGGLIALIWKIK